MNMYVVNISDHKLLQEHKENCTPLLTKKTRQIIQDKLLVTIFLFNGDQKNYNTLFQDLKNNSLEVLYS